MCNKILYFVGATVVMAVLLAIVLPERGHAGKPSSIPILDKLPPTWSQILPAAKRFEVVLDGAGVLDKETGLVWQKQVKYVLRTWYSARLRCDKALIGLQQGGRLGWHLPTIQQLSSLIDRSSDTFLKLPVGHPFNILITEESDTAFIWTVSPYPGGSFSVYAVNFETGFFDEYDYEQEAITMCVRGGQSYIGE